MGGDGLFGKVLRYDVATDVILWTRPDVLLSINCAYTFDTHGHIATEKTKS